MSYGAQEILIIITGRSKTFCIRQGVDISVVLSNFNAPNRFRRLCAKKNYLLRVCRRGEFLSQYEVSMNAKVMDAMRSFKYLGGCFTDDRSLEMYVEIRVGNELKLI